MHELSRGISVKRSLGGLAAILILLTAWGSSRAIAGSLVRDGGFETPDVPDGGLSRFGTGQKVAKWRVIGENGNVDIIDMDFTFEGFTTPAKQGRQWLDLTGSSNSATGVQQDLSTAPGSTYTLNLASGSAYDPAGQLGTSSTVKVLVNGTQIASLTFDAKPGSNTQQWRKFSLQFVAAGPTTTLGFINGDPASDTDNGIDAVSVILGP